MYTLHENIRIKTCDTESFFVNISNNSLYSIKTNTLNYLLSEIHKGLNENNISEYNTDFLDFVHKLESLNILKRYDDEN